MSSFEKLLAPLTLAEFAESYWRKSPVLASKDDEFSEILTVEEIDLFMNQFSLTYPSVKLIREGQEYDRKNYSLNYLNDFNFINKSEFFKCFVEGATIAIQAAHLQFERLNAFTSTLEKETNMEVHANIYITPSGEQGFHPHYDTHEVFVLQIFGQKTWNLYDIPLQAPLKGWHLPDEHRLRYRNSKPSHQVEISCGDVLYVPRGVVHDAFTTDSLSIHITIGLHPPTKIDLLKNLILKAENEPYYRETNYSFFVKHADNDDIFERLKTMFNSQGQKLGQHSRKQEVPNAFLGLVMIDNISTMENLFDLNFQVIPDHAMEFSMDEAEILRAIEKNEPFHELFHSIEYLKKGLKTLFLGGAVKIGSLELEEI